MASRLQDFLQVLSIFAAFKFKWPPALVAIYNAFSLASFNLELLAPECRCAAMFCVCVCALFPACNGLFLGG